MQPLTLSILADMDNLLSAQTAFVHAGGGDPLVAIFVVDGDVPAVSGCHVAAVNPLHGLDNLITRMEKREIHG